MANLPEAKQLLAKATTDCKSAKAIADEQGGFIGRRNRILDECAQLRKLPEDQASLIAKQVDKIESEVKLADSAANVKHKIKEATSILAKVDDLLSQTKSRLAMHTNLNSPAPNVDFVKMLVQEPGGKKALDDLVAKMGPKTNRQVLEVALEARFNIDLQQYLSQDGITIGTPPNEKKVHGAADNTAPDKSVKRIYEVLLKVPESHARTNPKVKEIHRFQEDTGGAAYYKSGRIDLNVGRAGASTSTNQGAQLGNPQFFPDGVDANCQPTEESKKKDIRYFDWATLHEVGHAVDDKNKFMEKNMAGTAFGGWKAHGSNVTEVADAAAKKFKYDLDYITGRLKWEEPDEAAKPADRSQADWDKSKQDFDTWCDIVMSLRLWWEGEATKKVALGGRVYQLAYGDKKKKTVNYVSYNLEARSRGIHGYQFRAPGEWFAELYAAYYMKVLKADHPAVKDWLPAKLK